jgi:hypothetical protein
LSVNITVAIMQPYFIPYAGYFRLLTATDLFVIYDCVQFPRRGWVHRNRLPDARGRPSWLTLPLAKAPRDVLIRDLAFLDNAEALLAARLKCFPLASESGGDGAPVLAALRSPGSEGLADYLVRLIALVAEALRLPWRALRSSSLAIPPELHGQERILEILRRLGAKRYVNAPGGRALYDPAAFDAAGIELRFLSEYPGPSWSVLWRLASEGAAALRRDIDHATALTT